MKLFPELRTVALCVCRRPRKNMNLHTAVIMVILSVCFTDAIIKFKVC